MTEAEIQSLFTNYSFSEAKEKMKEELDRLGVPLNGTENAFTLKSMLLNSSSASKVERQTTVQAYPLAEGDSGNSQNPDQQGNSDGSPSGKPIEGGDKKEGGEGQKPEPYAGSNLPNQDPQEPQPQTQQQNAQQGAEADGQDKEGGQEKKQRRKRKDSQDKQGGQEKKQRRKRKDSQDKQDKTIDETIRQSRDEALKKSELAKKLMEEANAANDLANRMEEEARKRKEEEERKKKCKASCEGHAQVDEVVRRLKCLGKAFLIGPAGTGKSTLAMCACAKIFGMANAAEAVKSDKFAQISFSPDTVSADMIGFTDVNGVYHETEIVRVFRDGGLILFDEMDDADASLLVKLNTMLANGVIPTPNGIVTQNPETYIVGTANTYGKGGNAMYVGRSRLDGATLDRWRMATIDIYYDEKMEMAMLTENLPLDKAEEIMTATVAIRKDIMDNKWKSICSTRFVVDAMKMSKCGYGINQILDTYFLDWDDNQRRLVKKDVVDAIKKGKNE